MIRDLPAGLVLLAEEAGDRPAASETGEQVNSAGARCRPARQIGIAGIAGAAPGGQTGRTGFRAEKYIPARDLKNLMMSPSVLIESTEGS